MKKRQGKPQWVTNDCSSGKRAYVSRADARQVAGSRRRRGVARLSVYQCEECEHFHIGHLPIPVVRGEVAREDIWQPGIRNPKRRSEQ